MEIPDHIIARVWSRIISAQHGACRIDQQTNSQTEGRVRVPDGETSSSSHVKKLRERGLFAKCDVGQERLHEGLKLPQNKSLNTQQSTTRLINPLFSNR